VTAAMDVKKGISNHYEMVLLSSNANSMMVGLTSTRAFLCVPSKNSCMEVA
jgi:hypothetical protein